MMWGFEKKKEKNTKIPLKDPLQILSGFMLMLPFT